MRILNLLLALLIIPTTSCAYNKKSKVLFIEGNRKVAAQETWRLTRNDYHDVKQLVEILEKTKHGKTILSLARKKAAKSGKTLYDVVKPGYGSVTDTTLIRRFSNNSPETIVYEEKSHVTINEDLPLLDAVLDLAHELTHFVHRQTFNPYELNFKMGGFIKSTIEGKGGEVDAFITECKVLRELKPRGMSKAYKCEKFFDHYKGHKLRANVIRSFYKVGEYYKFMANRSRSKSMRGVKRKLSGNSPEFISSAYGLPYPVAALKEYKTIVDKVCDNDRKRLSYLKATFDRAPAAQISDNEKYKVYRHLSRGYQSRCK